MNDARVLPLKMALATASQLTEMLRRHYLPEYHELEISKKQADREAQYHREQHTQLRVQQEAITTALETKP